MALFGIVFALGAGQAVAQVTVSVAETVDEGARVPITVGGDVSLDAGSAGGNLTVTIATVAAGTADGTVTVGEADDFGTWGTATIPIPANSGTEAVEHTVSGTFDWVVGTDIDAEDEAVSLTYTVTSPAGVSEAGTPDADAVTIDDSHMQMFEWGPVPTLKEGGTAMITLTANPAPVQLEHSTNLLVEGATGYTISPTSFVFDSAEAVAGEDGPIATITITAPTNDSNRVDDTIMLRALAAGTVTDRADPLPITVGDNNKLPTVTAKLMDEDGDPVPAEGVTEGDVVTLTFEVEDAASEDITITLMPAPANTAMADDYSLDEMEATIASGDTASDELTLTTMSNDDIMDDMLVLTGAVTGADANGTAAGDPVMVVLTIMDGTMLNVTPKTDAEVQAVVDAEIAAKSGPDGVYRRDDGDLNFMAGQFFTIPETGFDVAVSHSESGADAVWVNISGMNIDIGSNSMYHEPGTETITLTAVVSSRSASTQKSPNSASVSFEVTVHPDSVPPVTAKSLADVMAAYMEARAAAAGADQRWTASDGPAS